MRLSKKKHPLAVLRIFLGLGQKKLADVVGCSVRTIQAIELLQLKLSEDLAARIVDQTNIDPAWLLNGDPKAAPLNWKKKPYCRDDYESAQALAWKRQKDDKWWRAMKGNLIGDYQFRLATLIVTASRKVRWELVGWQVDQALTQLEHRYGIIHKRDEK